MLIDRIGCCMLSMNAVTPTVAVDVFTIDVYEDTGADVVVLVLGG